MNQSFNFYINYDALNAHFALIDESAEIKVDYVDHWEIT